MQLEPQPPPYGSNLDTETETKTLSKRPRISFPGVFLAASKLYELLQNEAKLS